MTPRVVTVFGASGFLGRHVVRALAPTRAEIRAVARRPLRCEALKPAGEVGQIVPLAGDVTDEASVAAAVAGADAVVNLVGTLYERGRRSFRAIHVDGAARIARAAASAGAERLIHVSALGADPRSPSDYARSKTAGEAAVRAAFPAATILRPSILFGPEDEFFNRFACFARLLPALPLIGGGHTLFQPVYVGDAAEAVAAALARDEAAGRTYELAGPSAYSFRALMELLLAEIGRRRLLIPVPFALASLEAWFLEFLPTPPLTRDQVRLLHADSVASGQAPGLADLGIVPTSCEVILPTYLGRYRRGVQRAPR